ncbi:MAG: hypothetical protein AAF705_08820 [Bacteroidota bacterium]
MARQAIGFKVKKGVIGDLQFTRRKGGDGRTQYIVGGKSGVDKTVILNDPKFANTRRNMSEFGRAASMSNYFGNLCHDILPLGKDGQSISRFTGLVRKLMNLDTENVKGERVLNLSLPAVAQGLAGFSWSKERFGNVMIGSLGIAAIDNIAVTLGGSVGLNSPVFADGFVVRHTVVSKDLAGNYVTNSVALNSKVGDGYHVLDGEIITHGGTAGEMLLVIASVEFYQTVNSFKYSILDKSHRAITIVYAGVVPTT